MPTAKAPAKQPSEARPTAAKNAALGLRSDDPPTPARVHELSRFSREALKACGVDPNSNDVTMVVSNRATSVELRFLTPTGKAAIAATEKFLSNPTRASQQDAARAQKIAAALAPLNVKESFPGGLAVVRPSTNKTIVEITPSYIDVVRQIKKMHEAYARGTTVIYTRVLRVGRASETGILCARVLVQGTPTDISVCDADPELTAQLFDLAKACVVARLGVAAVWNRGDRRLEGAHSAITSARRWDGANGREFMKLARAALGEHEVPVGPLDEPP